MYIIKKILLNLVSVTTITSVNQLFSAALADSKLKQAAMLMAIAERDSITIGELYASGVSLDLRDYLRLDQILPLFVAIDTRDIEMVKNILGISELFSGLSESRLPVSRGLDLTLKEGLIYAHKRLNVINRWRRCSVDKDILEFLQLQLSMRGDSSLDSEVSRNGANNIARDRKWYVDHFKKLKKFYRYDFKYYHGISSVEALEFAEKYKNLFEKYPELGPEARYLEKYKEIVSSDFMLECDPKEFIAEETRWHGSKVYKADMRRGYRPDTLSLGAVPDEQQAVLDKYDGVCVILGAAELAKAEARRRERVAESTAKLKTLRLCISVCDQKKRPLEAASANPGCITDVD